LRPWSRENRKIGGIKLDSSAPLLREIDDDAELGRQVWEQRNDGTSSEEIPEEERDRRSEGRTR
jgi:hypothetical protein